MVELRASGVQVCGLFSISVASVLYYLVSLRTPAHHMPFACNGRVPVLGVYTAVRAVMLNLGNKFSQCTFSVAEHYDLFSGLIILRQA